MAAMEDQGSITTVVMEYHIDRAQVNAQNDNSQMLQIVSCVNQIVAFYGQEIAMRDIAQPLPHVGCQV